MTRFVFQFLILLWPMSSLHAQSVEELIAAGNDAYQRKEFTEAERYYEEAIAADIDKKWPQAIYNLGNAIYQQKRYDNAIQQFEAVQKSNASDELKSAALYNIGNGYLQQKNYEKAMASYKEALRLNPRDEDARYNVSYIMTILNKQQTAMKKRQEQKEAMPKLNNLPPLTPEEQKRLMEELASSENQTLQSLQNQVRQKKLKKDW